MKSGCASSRAFLFAGLTGIAPEHLAAGHASGTLLWGETLILHVILWRFGAGKG